MSNIKPAMEGLVEASFRHQVRLMIGGTSVSHSHPGYVGIDGHVPRAAWTVDLVHELLRV